MIDEETRAAAARASLSVQDLLQFERLLADLSAGFINLPAARIDSAIEDGLRRIVETLGIDRSTLTRVSSASGRVEITHSFAVEGVEPLPRLMSMREIAPWALAMASAGKPVVFARLDDLPPEASVDKATYRASG